MFVMSLFVCVIFFVCSIFSYIYPNSAFLSLSSLSSTMFAATASLYHCFLLLTLSHRAALADTLTKIHTTHIELYMVVPRLLAYDIRMELYTLCAMPKHKKNNMKKETEHSWHILLKGLFQQLHVPHKIT